MTTQIAKEIEKKEDLKGIEISLINDQTIFALELLITCVTIYDHILNNKNCCHGKMLNVSKEILLYKESRLLCFNYLSLKKK